MSIEQPAQFTNESFAWAVESYPHDPGEVSHEVYATRLTACDACPMQRSGKCLAGLCCGAVITQAARRREARGGWYLCPWGAATDAPAAG